jgi:hypothetical protein
MSDKVPMLGSMFVVSRALKNFFQMFPPVRGDGP